MTKLIYLAKRKPGFTQSQFIARWRQHGALAMSLSLWRHMTGYAQADVLHPSPLPGTSEEYDGIGLLWAPSDEMWRNPDAADLRDVKTMLDDEPHTFAHPIPEMSIIAETEMRRDAGEGRTTAFLYFIDRDRARKAADLLAANLDERIDAIELNIAKDLGAFAEPVTPYRAVIEVAARDGEKLAGAMTGKSRQVLQDADLAVVARKAILWG